MEEEMKYQKMRGNRQYKDSLFRLVFRKKKDLLELYNAVNGTDYKNAEDLEINTLENVLYMKVKNDSSFLIGCTMNLYEHQSSYNPNMPLRGLMYFAKLYNIYAEKRQLKLYSSALQKIPTPKYIVFYNGLKEEPDRQVLKLSDAFESEGGCLECEAVMLNINFGHNRELMKRCRRLEEYAVFVDTVRKCASADKSTQEEAISRAIEECIRKGILTDILKEERAEVVMYILEAFDEELYERDLKDIAYENGVRDGKETGLKEGRETGLREGEAAARAAAVENVMRNLKLPLEEACRALGISVEEYEKARECSKG